MEHQFKPWQPVIVRNFDDEEWKPTFYAWKGKNEELHYTLGLGWRRQVLPAKGNRHLIGTTDSPTLPEPEFKFGDMVEVQDNGDKEWRKARFMYKNECESVPLPYIVFFEDNQDIDMFAYCRHAKKEG